MTMTHTWYTWSAGPRGIWRTAQDAWTAWERYGSRCSATYGQSGSTVTGGRARLYACRTRALARTVDLSEIRDGETVISHG